jgi:hypothetical protein
MLVLFLPETPAQALLFRTWVSSTGSDLNLCDRTTPCATLGRAVSQTEPGGEVEILDSGVYEGTTITQAVSIVNKGAIGVYTGGIVVNAGPSDIVRLHGLQADDIILFLSGAALHVENCQITHNFVGINFEPSGASKLFVSDTIVWGVHTQGILIAPTGAGTADVVLERVQAINNGTGIAAAALASSGSGTVINVAVRDSVASGNSNAGIVARSQVGGPNVVMTLDHVAATSNGVGIEADGSDMGAGGVALSNTQVSGNGTGLSSVNGGVLVSFQNNYVIGNGTDGAPTTTVAPK